MTKFFITLSSAFMGAVIFFLISIQFPPKTTRYEAEITALSERVQQLEDAAEMTSTQLSPAATSANNKKFRLLQDAGFNTELSLKIMENEQKIRDLLALANQNREDPRLEVQEMLQELKTLLGENRYADYLEATGRAASIEIESILADGIALHAGLQINDQIIRYAGERVYSAIDLDFAINAQSTASEIELEFIRNEKLMTISINSGKLGIKGPRNYDL